MGDTTETIESWVRPVGVPEGKDIHCRLPCTAVQGVVPGSGTLLQQEQRYGPHRCSYCINLKTMSTRIGFQMRPPRANVLLGISFSGGMVLTSGDVRSFLFNTYSHWLSG